MARCRAVVSDSVGLGDGDEQADVSLEEEDRERVALELVGSVG